MSWVRVDDKFPFHPKTMGLPLSAVGLWVTGLCWANMFQTDGRVPESLVQQHRAEDVVTFLESRGLWQPIGGGWLIHDYLEYQPSKQQIVDQAVKSAERVSRYRERTSNADVTPLHLDVTHVYADVTTPPNPIPNPNPKEKDVLPDQKQLHDWFDGFWVTYPRREAKGKAMAAFKAALKRAVFEDILAGAERYRDDPNRDPQFTAHPATWLNQDRWLDEALPSRVKVVASATSIALKAANEPLPPRVVEA